MKSRIHYILTLISIILSAFLAEASEVPAKNVSTKNFTIVIDAGHGGRDVGAVDNNVKEKDINLEVAKKLASRIKRKLKNVKVVMTRDDDTFVTLQSRADIANSNKGNLFISIHTNSVDKANPNRKKVAGASVYALGPQKDQNNLQVARRENSVIELEQNYEQKYSGFDPSKDESYIIFEMAQKKNLGQSLKFADMAQKSLIKEAGRADRGVKQAGFWVLWATSMPSVLVELDFICNPESAKFMDSDSGKDKLADALFSAVQKYVATYAGKTVAELSEDEDSVYSASEDSGITHISPKEITQKSVATSTASKSSSAVAKRKRRSEAGRNVSANRSVESADINLKSENKVDEVKTADTPKVQNKSSVEAPAAPGKKTHKSVSGYHSKSAKVKTIYKIQILASADLLKQNNPQFCGLSPISSFKENNLYKYTYGESESRAEMERLLKTVREKIPDAFIIKTQK